MARHPCAVDGVFCVAVVCLGGNLATWSMAGAETRGHDCSVVLRLQKEPSDRRAHCGRDVSSDRCWLDDLATDGIPSNPIDRLRDHRFEAPFQRNLIEYAAILGWFLGLIWFHATGSFHPSVFSVIVVLGCGTKAVLFGAENLTDPTRNYYFKCSRKTAVASSGVVVLIKQSEPHSKPATLLSLGITRRRQCDESS